MSARLQTAEEPAPVPLEVTDPVAATAANVIGGPLGRFAGLARRGWAGAASVLIALGSLAVSLGVVQKGHCVQNGWTAPSMYWRTCFSDLPLLYTGSTMKDGTIPYLGGKALDEPLLNGVLMWLVGLVTPGGGSKTGEQAWYFGLWALVGMLLLAGAIAATAWGRPREAWRASHLALSPVIVIAGLLSPDLFGVALVALGCAAWYRRRFTLSGIALGLALLTGSYPILVVAGIVLVAARAGRIAEGIHVASTAVLTGIVTILPFIVLGPPDDLTRVGWHPENVTKLYTAWTKQSAGYGSLWKVVSTFTQAFSANHLTLIGWLGFVWAVLVGAIVAFGLKRRVGIGPVVLSMIATAMLTGKSLPVQQALWLLPLIALTAVPWRDHLVWAATEIIHFVAVWMHIPASFAADKAMNGTWYAIFSVVRLLGICYLVWSAIHHAHDESWDDDAAREELEDPHADFLDAAPRGFGKA